MFHRFRPSGRRAASCAFPFAFATTSLLLAAAACGPDAARAQPAATIVVTGSREPLAPERLAADVAVIGADTLADHRADSLGDLLRREAGIQISRSGGPGQSTGMLLRGANSQQSIVLVDGMRVGSATLGYAALETLGLAQVDRIEVLRGPGSALYGADAVGGVVQIFTRGGAGVVGTQFEGRAAVGGHGGREGSAVVRGGGAVLDYAASVSAERSRGVSALRPGDAFGSHNPDADGFELESAQFRLGARPVAGHRVALTLLRTRLNSQYDATEYAAPTFTPDASPDFRTRQSTTVAALDWRGTLGTGVVGSARAARSVDDARNGGNVIDRFRTARRQLAAQLAWQTGALGQLVGAVEHQVDEGRSSSYPADVERRNRALVAELTGGAGLWSWQAGGRRDDSSDFGAVDTARLGAAVALAPGLKLRALAGNTFRAPSFNDLYYPGYGVPTIGPERGRSVEVGVDWTTPATTASATLWRNRVRDLVGYEPDASLCPPDPAYLFGCARNVARARLEGATLAGRHRAGALALQVQLDFLEARDAATAARLPRRAAHQATLGADWHVAGWRWGASVLRVGARPDGGKRLGAETTLDLSTTWNVAPAWQVQAKLLNATDERIEPARDYQGLGRQAWLALRWEPKT